MCRATPRHFFYALGLAASPIPAYDTESPFTHSVILIRVSPRESIN